MDPFDVSPHRRTTRTETGVRGKSVVKGSLWYGHPGGVEGRVCLTFPGTFTGKMWVVGVDHEPSRPLEFLTPDAHVPFGGSQWFPLCTESVSSRSTTELDVSV